MCRLLSVIISVLIATVGFSVAAVTSDSVSSEDPQVVADSLAMLPDGLVEIVSADTVPLHLVRTEVTLEGDTVVVTPEYSDGVRVRAFNPDPIRAVWLSALCPGLGQIYNRRFWKLPIVVGAYMGLAYATSWNNEMLSDYTTAYRDLMDNDPDTKSYMNFFAPGVKESDLNRTWLENVFKSRKNTFRRNRDLCIISMVGVYLVAIVDAYVDASLAHFDISPDLSLDWSPTVIPDVRGYRRPGLGVQWAFTF